VECELADARTHEEERVAELQSKHDAQCKRLEAVEEEYDELISELRSEHSSHCSKLENELSAARAEIEALKSGAQNHESMVAEVQSLKSAASAVVQQHQSELKRISIEHQTALQQQNDDAKKKMEALVEEHAQKMADLQQSLDAVTSKLATQQQENEVSSRAVRQQQDECDSLRQQLAVSAERAAAEQQRMHAEALQLLEKLSRAEAAATSSNQSDLVSDQATELMTLRTRVSELQMQLGASDNQHSDVVAQLTKQSEVAAKTAAEALEVSTVLREQQDALAIRSELDAAKQVRLCITFEFLLIDSELLWIVVRLLLR
jgi:chromosome segregation ATPase